MSDTDKFFKKMCQDSPCDGGNFKADGNAKLSNLVDYKQYFADNGVCIPVPSMKAKCIDNGFKSAKDCSCKINDKNLIGNICRTNLGIIDIYIFNNTQYTLRIGAKNLNITLIKADFDTNQAEDAYSEYLNGFDRNANKTINPSQQVWWRAIGFCGSVCSQVSTDFETRLFYEIIDNNSNNSDNSDQKIGDLIICARRKSDPVSSNTCTANAKFKLYPITNNTYGDIEPCSGEPYARINPPNNKIKLTSVAVNQTSLLHITLDAGNDGPTTCINNPSACGPGDYCNAQGQCVPISGPTGPSGNGGNDAEVQRVLFISLVVVLGIIVLLIIVVIGLNYKNVSKPKGDSTQK